MHYRALKQLLGQLLITFKQIEDDFKSKIAKTSGNSDDYESVLVWSILNKHVCAHKKFVFEKFTCFYYSTSEQLWQTFKSQLFFSGGSIDTSKYNVQRNFTKVIQFVLCHLELIWQPAFLAK